MEKQINPPPGTFTGETVDQRGIWKRFFHACRSAQLPYGFLAFYVVLVILQGFLLVSIPQVNGNFFAGDVSIGSVAMFIGLEIASMILTQGVLYVDHIVRYRTNRNLRNVLWGKILKLKPSYFDRVSASTLISRITVDADSLNAFVLDVVLESITRVYYLAVTIVAMSAISIKAGLILLAFIPFTLLISFTIGRLNLKFQNAAKFSLANLTEYLSELISALPLLKAFNMQASESKRGDRMIDNYYRANRRLIALDVLNTVLGSVVGILPEIVIIIMGIKLLGNGTFDTAGWYAFYLYAGTFIGFFNTLGGIWRQSKSIQGQLNKVTDILYEKEESTDAYVEKIIADGDIQFDHVTFSYDEQPVLKDVSLTIPGGKITAIVGYSGSGKTTLVKLLERIYEPDAGRILCGADDISKQDVRSWRGGVAYVMQETPLLSGTIRDNLLYGIRRPVSDEEIRQAVELASLDKFIASLDDGLDHEVGQFGANLSGGQRQKIAIAGAILSQAKLLILDEPTASLDIISTNEILHTVSQLKGSRTVVLITHDKEAVRAADHVIVAEGDSKFCEGSPDQVGVMSEFFCKLMEGGQMQE